MYKIGNKIKKAMDLLIADKFGFSYGGENSKMNEMTWNGAWKMGEKIMVGELDVYPDKYEVYIKQKEIALTPKEFELLAYLARNKGREISRDQLLNVVWQFDFTGDTRIVDIHVSHLREKIEQNTRKPTYIKTIRGFGYKLEEPE